MGSTATPSACGWWKLSMAHPGDLEESLLWRLPGLGVHRVAVLHHPAAPEERELVAWLPAADWTEDERRELESALQPLAEPFALPLPLPPLRWELVEDEDWSLVWKKHWAPDPVGSCLLVLPAWLPEPPEAEGRRVIRLDPGPAFGTGSHPTTRLCLEGLEAEAEKRIQSGAPVARPLEGLRVADLGCGSGLLGLAALAMGAERVLAVDTDLLAVRATVENAALNGFTAITVAHGSAPALEELLEGRPADLLLCNILAPVIADLADSFPRLLAAGGRGLLSGLLVSQAEDLLSLLEGKGWTTRRMATKEPWALLEIRDARGLLHKSH